MISDQHFAIPPSHPIAPEFYDLQIIEANLISHLIPGHPHHDPEKQDEYEKALALTGDRMRQLQDQIRSERGGDASCRVGLTLSENGYPLVDGRPRNGMPFIQGGGIRLVVSN
jgi:hypothetical protein